MSNEHIRQEIDLGLARMERLMDILERPDKAVPVIHVAGTNGKGSTCTFMASILKNAGLKTGLYTSPAVFDPHEIIRINGRKISEESLIRLKNKVLKAGDELVNEGFLAPTEFEALTAAAFLYFKEQGCDIAIAEVGLGGDLDATNVCTNKIASVFTPISLDHTAFLGNTLKEIAEHKSGIIKERVPVFSVKQEPEVRAVLKERAKEHESAYYETRPFKASLICGHCMFLTEDDTCIRLGLPGSYQSENAALAVTALSTLRERGEKVLLSVPESFWDRGMRRGLEQARLNGRFERISAEPDIYLDGAHNPGAARELKKALSCVRPGIKRIYVFGAFKDKDYLEVARTVMDDAHMVITAKAPGERGESADIIAEKLKKELLVMTASYEMVSEAVAAAKEEAAAYKNKTGSYPVIVCFGSLSWLAAARDAALAE